MPDLNAFRGIRFGPKAGRPADLVAPPYDVIGAEEHVALCRRSPFNVVRLILGERASPHAHPPPQWYEEAGRLLASWRREGLLLTDAQPAFYLYTEVFYHAGERRQRKLLLGALRLERYETGRILPHEYTRSGPKADRLRLLQACRANLSPILAFFPDPDGRVNGLLDSLSASEQALTFTDDAGIRHSLCCVREGARQAELAEALSPLPLYIADGHHRYETALVYRDLQRAASPNREGELPCDFMLAACMSSADPGLVIRPTHRVVRWENAPEIQDLLETAREWFTVETLGVTTPQQALDALATRWDAPSFVVYGGPSTGYALLELRDEATMDDAPYAPQSPVRQLPAAVFAHAFLAKAFAGREIDVTYTPDADEAVARTAQGGNALAGLLPSVRPAELVRVADAGERMPPKSTYFWPKPLTGLVLRSLEEF